MIAIIDYGAGNLHSVEKALRFVGADVRRFQNGEGLDYASAAVLPGVGAFDDCINSLQGRDLLEASSRFIRSGKPFLGICVGYQALFERSEEFNSCAAGMKVFQGSVVHFFGKDGLKVPQIGWNQIRIAKADCPLFREIPDQSYFYFVHSFFRGPKMIRLSPRELSMEKPSRRQSGARMFSLRSSIPRRAKKSVCNC